VKKRTLAKLVTIKKGKWTIYYSQTLPRNSRFFNILRNIVKKEHLDQPIIEKCVEQQEMTVLVLFLQHDDAILINNGSRL
jgi:hypothetical protein